MREIKERFRLDRHRQFLAAARDIVNANGLAGLTMPGLAEQLDCGIGTLYQHFPSKDALIGELQREALDIIDTSFRLSQARIDELLLRRRRLDPATAALARAVVAARFWIAAENVFPQEIDLSRRMFIEPAATLDDEAAHRVVPAALRLLDLARQLVEDAAAAGAIEDGPSVQRAIVIIAGTTGVLMTSAMGRWDETLFNGQELAALMVRDLFRGWGAALESLHAVDKLVADLEKRDELVPSVRR